MGVVMRDNGGDLCWMGNDRVPKTKVSAGPYKRMAPEAVRTWVGQLLDRNRGMLAKISKFCDVTHESTKGPVPAFAFRDGCCVRDAIFPYICVQRPWPMDKGGTRLPWHVDGGPSICFMAVTLEGSRILEFETWQEKNGIGMI